MIISCPNCGARYRLAVTVLAENTRMRCATCVHRWIAEAEDVQAVFVPPAPAEVPPEPPPPPPAPPPPAPPPAPEVPLELPPELEEPARSTLLRTLAAVVIGGALAVAAGAIWVARIDPQTIPMLGDDIAAMVPGPLPLKLAFTARTTPLPSGERLLEINGTVRNTGATTVTLPDLEARLSSPGTTVRRWRIAPPVAQLRPGTSVAFTSTATDFPAEATIVAIRPAK